MNAAAQSRKMPWLVALLVVLFTFEITREILILEEIDSTRPRTSASFVSSANQVTAMGSWKRIDGGDQLSPTAVTIDCRRDTGQCIEATVMMMTPGVSSPLIDWFYAKFSEDSISYVNDVPTCSTYYVRLDLKLRKVFSVVERAKDDKNPMCLGLDPRIESQLADGRDLNPDPLKGHFLPIFGLFAAIYRAATNEG